MSQKSTKKFNQHLGFDDRWYALLGIPIVAFFASTIFVQSTPYEYFDHFWIFFSHGLIFTSVYWWFNRTVMIFLRKRLPSVNQTLKRLLLQLLFIICCYPFISWLVISSVDFVCAFVLEFEDLHSHETLTELITTYVLTFMVLAVYEATYFFMKYKELIVAQERNKTEHVSSQLVQLRNQVNPHFLFNSLNTLMSLIPEKSLTARQYLQKLSNFYRYSVSERDELLVPLKKEVEIVRLYADLVQERFGDKFKIDFEIQETDSQMILPMSLQLLVENALKHNIVSTDEPLRVRVYTAFDYVHVENNKQPRITEIESTGMGLKNIVARFGYVTNDKVHIEETKELFKVSLPIIH